MKRIIVFTIIFLSILSAGIIYLFNRPCDYKAHFTVNTTPDIAFYYVYNWDLWNRKHLHSKTELLSNIPVSSISQKVLLDDTTLVFNWEFGKLNDSATIVRVCVSDPERRIYNRLTAPLKNTSFKNSARNNLLDIKTRFEFMLKTFHREFTGYHYFEKKTCVYINIKSATRDKALAMMANVTDLNQFVRQNNLELNGNPFLVVHDWKGFNDSISFDFCFPITNVESVPEHAKIKLMTVDSMDAIKTDFFGNYSITDVTWYNLSKEAKLLGYRSNNKLIEVYLNDPHAGGNELEWKAEIYFGIEPVN